MPLVLQALGALSVQVMVLYALLGWIPREIDSLLWQAVFVVLALIAQVGAWQMMRGVWHTWRSRSSNED